MSLVHSEAFVGMRCRLYRRKDARIINAWVQYFRGSSIVVTTDDEFEGESSEHFYIEAFGSKVKACLDASFVKSLSVGGQDEENVRTAITLKVNGQIQVSHSDEPPRQLVEGMSVELEYGAMTFTALVRDISREGIGIISQEPWNVGMSVEIKIKSPLGPIQAEGEVKYVKPANGQYRIGIHIDRLSRLDDSRWRLLLGEAA